MLILSSLLPAAVICGVLDIKVSKQVFSTNTVNLNVDDSVVFTVDSNTTLTLCQADCTPIGNPTDLVTGGTFLKTFTTPETVYMSAGDCSKKLEIVTKPFPTNPYIQMEALLLEQYDKQMEMIQAKAQQSGAIYLSGVNVLIGCLMLMI